MTRVDEAHALAAAFERVIATALEEDLGETGAEADVTTRTVVEPSQMGSAVVRAKGSGVICGLDALATTFRRLDDRVVVGLESKDGDDVEPMDTLATIEGPAAAILIGERTALNLLGHLSGIATFVRSFARRAPGVAVTDTRKTLPGLRLLQKYAVRTGGGSNHRYALWDGVLIKDNHIVAAGSVGEAVRRARAQTAFPVQVECSTRAEVDEALAAGAPAILLDNQGVDQLRELTAHIKATSEHVLVEASGGVRLETIGDIAATGVDRVSVGAFTHSAPALDVSLELTRVWSTGREG